MRAAEIRPILEADPVFAMIPPEQLDQLCERMTPVSFSTGHVVFNAGDEGDAFYVVGSGKARVVLPLGERNEVNLGLVQAGGYFGEQALLTGARRAATVRATEELTLLKLDRTDFLELVGRVPQLVDRLRETAGEASVRGFLRRVGKLVKLDAKTTEKLAQSMTPRSVEAGAVILREGDPPDDVYIVKMGRVEVLKRQQGRNVVVGEVPIGGFFGELGVMTGLPRQATVVARSAAELLRVPGKTFVELLAPTEETRKKLLEGLSAFLLKGSQPEEAAAAEPQSEVIAARQAAADTPVGTPVTDPSLPFQRVEAPGTTGLACLAMVRAAHGVADAEALPGVADGRLDEIGLWSLAEAAESLGLSARGCQMSWDILLIAALPVLVPFRGKGWVVVYRVAADHVVIANPDEGLRRLTRDEFLRGWSGRALAVTPRTGMDREREGLRMLMPLIRPHWRMLANVVVAAVALNACGMSIPFLTQLVIDQVLTFNSMALLNTMTSGVMILTIFVVALKALQRYWSVWIATRINLALVDQFYRHSLDLPVSYYAKNKVGDVTARFDENEKVQDFLTQDALKGLLDAVLVVMYTGTMLFINPVLGSMVVAFLPCYFGMTLAAAPWLAAHIQKSFEGYVAAESALIESISGIGTVKGLALENAVQRRWEGHFLTFVESHFKALRLGLVAGGLTTFFSNVATTSIMFVGAFQVLADKMSVGALMAFYALMSQILKPVQELMATYGKYQMSLLSLYRVNEVLDVAAEESAESRRYRYRLPPVKGHVLFEDVQFAYNPEEGPLIIKGIRLEIQPGQMCAIVGRSGAGKSTLAHLLLRLQRPTSGRVLLDGYDLEGVDGSSLRRQVGAILQDSFLFAGSIRQNIAPMQQDASLERIQAAAVLAGAHDFIMKLPKEYDTIVGERGASLSGGQRQRISIARALFADPKVLIMDEATSALDTESERAIQENLAKLLAGRTTLVIAHRLSTVQAADKIVVLDQGLVVEEGTHSELMAAEGLYYHLASQQIQE